MKNKTTRPLEWIVWGALALVIAAIFGAYAVSRRTPETRVPLPVLATVPPFALTNQFGDVVELEDLRGQVWVADIIFTRCPGPCPIMSREMGALQTALRDRDGVRLVSLTADAAFDTPEVLKEYGKSYGALSDRWLFLTGNQRDLYDLATRGLLLAVAESEADKQLNPNDLFVHSTKFVVVDRAGRVRGSFDGTDAGSRGEVLAAIDALLEEKVR